MEKGGFTEVQSKKSKKKAKVMAQVVEDQQNRRRGHQGDPASPVQAPQKKPSASPTQQHAMELSPPQKSKFLAEAEQLKHADRITKAATAGRDMKGSKDLRGLIDSLRTVSIH